MSTSPASGSVEPSPLNVTASGMTPLTGVAVATAVGGLVRDQVADALHDVVALVDVQQVALRGDLEVRCPHAPCPANGITLPFLGSPSPGPGSIAQMQLRSRSAKNSAFLYIGGNVPPAAG